MSCERRLLAEEWDQPVAPGAERRFGVQFINELSRRWAEQLDYSINDQIPAGATGFDALCTAAGRRGAAEPRWLKTLGAVHIDGSVTWQLINPTPDSLETTVSTFDWTSPHSDITFSSQSDADTRSSAIIEVASTMPPGRYEITVTATCVNNEVIVQPCILTVE